MQKNEIPKMITNLKDKRMSLALKNENLNDLVSQYRCPKGDEGIAVDEFFHEINNDVIKESVKALELEDKNRILELGHGNCRHLPFVMEQAFQVKYFGMEISEVMLEEASRLNAKYIKKKEALFQMYNGVKVPYVHNIFDRILTINTIYFWKEPLVYLKEMFRVLKPGGKFVLTFTNSVFLEQLAMVSKGEEFVLYNQQKVQELVNETDFILNSMEEKSEKIKDSEGNLIDQKYTVVVLSKKPRNRYLELAY